MSTVSGLNRCRALRENFKTLLNFGGTVSLFPLNWSRMYVLPFFVSSGTVRHRYHTQQRCKRVKGMLGLNLITNEHEDQSSTFGLLTFPQRVYCILDLVESNRQEYIISWMNEGTAFKVHDPEAFERQLLPRYFNTAKYSSFTRALHAHGFKCERAGRLPGIYSHPWFERNNTDALYRIKRTKNSKNQAKDAIRNPASKPAEDTINSLPNNNRRHGLERPIRPQSLMSTKKTSGNEDNSASVFGQAFQTIQSLSRVLPERSQVTSQIDGDRDRVALKLPSPKPIPPSLPIPSRSSNVPTSSRRRIDHQPEDKAITRRNPPNIWSILDDQILPIPLVSRTIAGKQNEAKQSSEHTFDEISIRSLEPRSIQAMKQHPDVLNQRGSRICSLDFSWLRSKY